MGAEAKEGMKERSGLREKRDREGKGDGCSPIEFLCEG